MAEQEEERKHPHCPYCDEEIRNMNLPWCEACHVEVFYCPKCRMPVERDKTICPHCGVEITVVGEE